MITEELKKHVVEFVEMEQHSYSMDLMILENVATHELGHALGFCRPVFLEKL